MTILQPQVFFEEKYFYEAWTKLLKSGSQAAGVDGVRLCDVRDNSVEFIKNVQHKLLSNHYVPSPLKKIKMTQGRKERIVHLMTLEDRLIHNVVKCYLEPYCNHKFHPQSFAYQAGKSANQAIDQIENWLKAGYGWIGETDIRSFFDEIDHKILEQQLRLFIVDEEIIAFITYLFHQQVKGVIQGSPLSPLLSNIYLHSFDLYMTDQHEPYIRFSDDLIILDQSKDDVIYRIEAMKKALSMLKLEYDPEKTAIKHVSDSFQFLGFTFSEDGKKVATKGITSLIQKLDTIEDGQEDFETILLKYEQVLRGWQQYFQTIPWTEINQLEAKLLVIEFNLSRQVYN